MFEKSVPCLLRSLRTSAGAVDFRDIILFLKSSDLTIVISLLLI